MPFFSARAAKSGSVLLMAMFEPALKPSWWLPTFGFFLFLAIETSMFFRGDHLFEDPSVGRHLRTAEAILETGRVPRVDPLSFTHAGEPWLDFEWAFETTLGELYRFGGLGLINAFCYGLFAATMLGLYRTLLQSGFSLSVVVLYTGLAFLTLHLHFSVRPLLLTYLFLALVVEVWHRRVQPLKRDWFVLPIVFAAWANLHAGWLAAISFLILAMSGRLLDRLRGCSTGEEAPLIPWVGLTLLCLLATSFNPWGWSLLRQLLLYATTYQSFSLWDEFATPSFSGPSMAAITILFILTVVFLARGVRRAEFWRMETVLPVLFFLYEGLKAQRHVLLLMEVAAVPVARDLEVLLHGNWWPFLRGRLRDFQRRQRLAGGDAWLSFLAMILLAALYVRSVPAQSIRVGKSVTVSLTAFLREHPDRLQRPLVTTWNAGPLLWNLRPGFRVSFDDRGDFYGDQTVFSFVNLYNGVSGWRETLEKGKFDSAILDPALELNQLLPSVSGWREVYRDQQAVVYWRDLKG